MVEVVVAAFTRLRLRSHAVTDRLIYLYQAYIRYINIYYVYEIAPYDDASPVFLWI